MNIRHSFGTSSTIFERITSLSPNVLLDGACQYLSIYCQSTASCLFFFVLVSRPNSFCYRLSTFGFVISSAIYLSELKDFSVLKVWSASSGTYLELLQYWKGCVGTILPLRSTYIPPFLLSSLRRIRYEPIRRCVFRSLMAWCPGWMPDDDPRNWWCNYRTNSVLYEWPGVQVLYSGCCH